MNVFAAGLVLGLAASGHCLAMCGPLVLAVGRQAGSGSRGAHLRHALLYHTGRVLVYVLLALPAGIAGASLVSSGLGRALAIGAGVLLLAAALGSIRVRPLNRVASAYSQIVTRVSARVLRWTRTRPIAGPLVVGALNGVLPCGLVYAALTAAAATGTAAHAAVFMLSFGVGTASVLVTLSMMAASVPSSLRARMRPLTPVVLALAAVLLIARGVAHSHHHPENSPASSAHASH